MKYLLTGRSVHLTEDQRTSCAKRYQSLRALAYDNQIDLSKLIATLCSPDPHGGINDSCLILGNLDDLHKDPKTGHNEAVQLINTAGKALTIFRYVCNQLIYVKKRGQVMPIMTIFNKMTDSTPVMKLALVQGKWFRSEYADYLPCTEAGTDYKQNLANALKRIMSLMRRNQLDKLELVTDKYDRTVQTLLWIAEQTQTDVTMTFLAHFEKWDAEQKVAVPIEFPETATWKHPQTQREFLSCFPSLNVFRYETQDEHRIRCTRYSRPSVEFNDPNPVDHSELIEEPGDDKVPHFIDAEVEEQFQAALQNGIELVSYEAFAAKSFEADDDHAIHAKSRNEIGVDFTMTRPNTAAYAPHIIGHYKDHALIAPVCASEPTSDFTVYQDEKTQKLVHRQSGSGCALCAKHGTDFCKTCPYRAQ
jgi:hypothetical protein